ncbi:hypothetical protein DFH07DRAFT_961954 [Mycena maculata]|uniref:DUF659 domain-containing protein n=1 Tax=Mycena maculata TaxID=230809 RepID=A0AAD7ITH2_9AGAR|nr:hypothetical protein DFH07DRAFT_961954 [Mycena maculata]
MAFWMMLSTNDSKLRTNFPHLYKAAVQSAVDNAPSTLLKSGQAGSLPAIRKSKEKHQEQCDSICGPGSILEHFNTAKVSQAAQTFIDICLFQLFICCALSWSLLDNYWFRSFVFALAANYTLPTRSHFFTQYLVSEGVVMMQKLSEFLADKEHLTLSLDGWSSRGKDEIYTFHITTPA